MVSLIQSNYMGFGSGVVVPGTGISLQNRGAGFSLAAGACQRGGRRQAAVPHDHSRASSRKDGAPLAAFGVMGGPIQPPGHVQTLVRMRRLRHEPAGVARRAALEGRAERRMSTSRRQRAPELRDALVGMGHVIEGAPDSYMDFGAGQFIVQDRRRLRRGVGSAPRRAGGGVLTAGACCAVAPVRARDAQQPRVGRPRLAVDEGRHVPRLLVGQRVGCPERHVRLDERRGGGYAVHARALVVRVASPQRRKRVAAPCFSPPPLAPWQAAQCAPYTAAPRATLGRMRRLRDGRKAAAAKIRADRRTGREPERIRGERRDDGAVGGRHACRSSRSGSIPRRRLRERVDLVVLGAERRIGDVGGPQRRGVRAAARRRDGSCRS